MTAHPSKQPLEALRWPRTLTVTRSRNAGPARSPLLHLQLQQGCALRTHPASDHRARAQVHTHLRTGHALQCPITSAAHGCNEASTTKRWLSAFSASAACRTRRQHWHATLSCRQIIVASVAAALHGALARHVHGGDVPLRSQLLSSGGCAAPAASPAPRAPLLWHLGVRLAQHAGRKVAEQVVLVHQVGDAGLEGRGSGAKKVFHQRRVLHHRRAHHPAALRQQRLCCRGVLLPDLARDEGRVDEDTVERAVQRRRDVARVAKVVADVAGVAAPLLVEIEDLAAAEQRAVLQGRCAVSRGVQMR